MNQRVGVGSVPWADRDPDRHRRRQRFLDRVDGDPLFPDRFANALGQGERIDELGVGQKQDELLTSETRRHVVDPEVATEHVSDSLQDRIAGQMTVRVVDLTQQIEVDHQQGKGPLGAEGLLELLVQHGAEVADVVEARLRVEARLLLE